MDEYYTSPDEPKAGDRFEISEGAIHSAGEVVEVRPSRNAAGKPGHIVIWRSEQGELLRTRWSFFRDNARRVMRGTGS